MLDSSGELDSRGRGLLRIIDRKANVTELYVNHDSVWVEASVLESSVYSQAAGVQQV